MAIPLRVLLLQRCLFSLFCLIPAYAKTQEDAYVEIPMHKAMPPLMDPIPTLPTITHSTFMDIHIEGEGDVGRIVFGLFGDNSPTAVQHFLRLSACETEEAPCYTNSIFHRSIPQFGIQGGDVTRSDGTGGVPMPSSSSSKMMIETVKMTKPYLLAVAAAITAPAATSQFFVTTVKTQWLTGKHVVMGMVLHGSGVVDAIEAVGTYGGTPRKKVTITDSGVLPLQEEDRVPQYY